MKTQNLTKLSFEMIGDVFQPFIYGQKFSHIAINYKIPLVMFGENGEVEYGDLHLKCRHTI